MTFFWLLADPASGHIATGTCGDLGSVPEGATSTECPIEFRALLAEHGIDAEEDDE